MLRGAISEVSSVHVDETVFEVGDDFSKYTRNGIVAERICLISFARDQLFPLTEALAKFARSHAMAIRFQQ